MCCSSGPAVQWVNFNPTHERTTSLWSTRSPLYYRGVGFKQRWTMWTPHKIYCKISQMIPILENFSFFFIFLLEISGCFSIRKFVSDFYLYQDSIRERLLGFCVILSHMYRCYGLHHCSCYSTREQYYFAKAAVAVCFIPHPCLMQILR